MPEKIDTLDALDREIGRLQLKAKKLEEKLDDNLDYLQHNYSSMLLNSVFSRSGSRAAAGNGISGYLLGNERLQEMLARLVNYLVDKAASGLELLLSKFAGKGK